MAKLLPYLTFKQAKEALAYYEEVFGATNTHRIPLTADQASQWGMPTDHLEDTTVHGGFSVLGADLLCSDAMGEEIKFGNQITILLDVDSEDEQASKEADAFFEKVEASGTVTITMPYADQYWGGKMGIFTDKFGIAWMLHAQPYSKLEQPN